MIFINRINLVNKIYLWGTGQLAVRIMKQFKVEITDMHICGFIDNDTEKEGREFCGYKIYPPQVLSEDANRNCHVIIVSEYYKEIWEQIHESYLEFIGRCESYHFFIRYRLAARYRGSGDEEINSILQYSDSHGLKVFNYSFTEKYANKKFILKYDAEKDLYYTVYCDKRMYLCRFYRDDDLTQEYLREIMMEQDKLSPHCYPADDFDVNNGAIVVDAGVAEGNFALSIIDKVKRIYLVEPNREWAEALECTFAPYKDKVVIINKYLSNYESGETTTIDSIVKGRVDFIKMDIEGEEYYAIHGALDVIKRNSFVKFSVCTYHQEFDYLVIKNLFNSMGFETETSNGYMWFPYDKDYLYSLPTFRRGLIRAKRGEHE